MTSSPTSAAAFGALDGNARYTTALHPLWTPLSLAGRAFTVAAVPGDNLALHRAIALAPPDVVLVAQCETRDVAIWGEVMTVAALVRGLRGLVTDGAVRDSDRVRALGFPVFCRGRSPASAAKDAPGELDVPVVVAGAEVRPGDWIVADEDGVVVVPGDSVERVLPRVEEGRAAESEVIARVQAGELTMDVLGLQAAVE